MINKRDFLKRFPLLALVPFALADSNIAETKEKIEIPKFEISPMISSYQDDIMSWTAEVGRVIENALNNK